MRRTENEPPASIRREFRCDICGQTAGGLEVVSEEPPASNDKPGTAKVVATGFMPQTTWIPESDQTTALRAALLAGDVRRVHEIDPLLAPFYCPTCRQTYCETHWQVVLRFDDDFPNWYDCSYGTCPKGHRRLVDD